MILSKEVEIVSKGNKIKVLVKDLSKGSNIKILCECDICHKQRTLRFCDYTKLCQKCNHPKRKGGLPHCKNCEKELSRYDAEYCVSCKHIRLKGENNPNYNPKLNQDERDNKRNSISPWKRKVKQRDRFTCQKCGSKKNPQAHHINSYSAFRQERLDENNGVCLCKKCHKQIHRIFGLKTTREDFEAFMKL